MNPNAGPPQGVPTLTEVVQWPAFRAPRSPSASSDAAEAEASAMPPRDLPSEAQLTEAILADVQRQVDLMLEYRMREMLAPLLTRATDGLIRDSRKELASTLRDIVTRAVAQEISRHRGR